MLASFRASSSARFRFAGLLLLSSGERGLASCKRGLAASPCTPAAGALPLALAVLSLRRPARGAVSFPPSCCAWWEERPRVASESWAL